MTAEEHGDDHPDEQGQDERRVELSIISPAVRPAAVTKVAWARLTMPPMPVTTTKERKIRARASPRVVRPIQNRSAPK